MRKIGLGALCFFVSILYGDVMYEMTSTTAGMMGMKSETHMRVFVKGDRSLTEVTGEAPMSGDISDTRIIRLDKGVMWSIDHENKQYTEYAFKELAAVAGDSSEQDIEMPDIKVITTKEKKTILNKECEQVIVSMESKGEDGNVTFKQTMWVTKDIPGYKEIQDFQKKIIEEGLGSSSAAMGHNRKSYEDFQKKISGIEGFPLEIDMEITMAGEGMSFTMTTNSEVTKVETKPISDKVFEIPPSYSLQE